MGRSVGSRKVFCGGYKGGCVKPTRRELLDALDRVVVSNEIGQGTAQQIAAKLQSSGLNDEQCQIAMRALIEEGIASGVSDGDVFEKVREALNLKR